MNKMVKIFGGLVGLAAVASVAAAQTRVDYSQLRSFGDETNEGFVWQIGSGGPPFWPGCTSNPSNIDTIHGAAYAGSLNTGGFPTGAAEDEIHDMAAIVVFDASALMAAAPNGQFTLHLAGTTNFGLGGVLQVGLVPDDIVRDVLAGRGPFPGGFNRIFNADLAENGKKIAESSVIKFTPVVSSQDIVLSAGAQQIVTLNTCLGPTGQVRIIDPGNNGDWATECVAGGWRVGPTITSKTGGSPFNDALTAALANAPIVTKPFSCFPVLVTADRNQGNNVTINTPIAIAISVLDSGVEMDRGEEFLWQTLTFGGDNLIVLADDPTVPAAGLWINGQ